MLATASNTPHLYIQCDVPDGMTLVEWRRAHSQRKPRRFLRHSVRRLVRQLPGISRSARVTAASAAA
jgi:hypothetical protein